METYSLTQTLMFCALSGIAGIVLGFVLGSLWGTRERKVDISDINDVQYG